jgi:hypothetical protein
MIAPKFVQEVIVARRRKSSSNAPQLSAGQASYVLQRLISDRRISAAEVNRYMSEMRREITDLEERLQSLRMAAGAAVAAVVGRRRGRPAAAAAGTKRGAGGRRRRAAITPEQRQSRVIQGRYLGLIRQIPASRRGQYQKIAREKGREAAIKEMASALGK